LPTCHARGANKKATPNNGTAWFGGAASIGDKGQGERERQNRFGPSHTLA